MAATMNFFRAQDEARGRTTKLVVLLVLAILVLTGTLYVLAVLGQGKLLESGELEWFQPKLFLATSGVALAVILGGSLMRIAELSKGGGAIAVRLGGRLVSGVTKDPAERRYLNVVQEMALAAGTGVCVDRAWYSAALPHDTGELLLALLHHLPRPVLLVIGLLLVGGQWPLAALANRGVTVFDAVNAGGAPGEHRQRL